MISRFVRIFVEFLEFLEGEMVRIGEKEEEYIMGK